MASSIPYVQTSPNAHSSDYADDRSPSPFSSKLSTQAIFDRIRPHICSIYTSVGESSGFIIGENTVLTVAHNIPIENSEGEAQFTTDYLQVNHNGAPHFPTAFPGMVQKHASTLDLFPMNCEIQAPALEMLPEDFQLKEGMRVYFAGYPLGQDTITFHKGIISSIIENEEKIRQFTIDAMISPGNSGGPVVIQHEGKLFLAGMITSEVEDFSSEDKKTIQHLELLNHHYDIDPSGNLVEISIQTPQGRKKTYVNKRTVMIQALDLIRRNQPTKTGTAIDIRAYKHLFQENPNLSKKAQYSSYTAKGIKSISGVITRSQTSLVKYMEVRDAAEEGSRGIRIILCPELGEGSSMYKFTPNPHTSPGNYKNNPKELYSEAAKKFASLMYVHNKPPDSFSFRACGLEYTANLEVID